MRLAAKHRVRGEGESRAHAGRGASAAQCCHLPDRSRNARPAPPRPGWWPGTLKHSCSTLGERRICCLRRFSGLEALTFNCVTQQLRKICRCFMFCSHLFCIFHLGEIRTPETNVTQYVNRLELNLKKNKTTEKVLETETLPWPNKISNEVYTTKYTFVVLEWCGWRP